MIAIVKEITTDETLNIRQRILRPTLQVQDCIFPGDYQSSTHHFGAFINTELVGVVSLFLQACDKIPQQGGRQIRAMATMPEHRGLGVGLQLIQAAEDFSINHQVPFLWANARVTAKEFYRKAGYQVDELAFDIEGVGMHVLINKPLL